MLIQNKLQKALNSQECLYALLPFPVYFHAFVERDKVQHMIANLYTHKQLQNQVCSECYYVAKTLLQK